MKTVWIDGSCIPNPGEGGWGVIGYNDDDSPISLSGYAADTTNNIMEMTALIQALELVTSEELTVYADSDYVRLGATEWLALWKKRNWDKVKNADLWKHIDALLSTRKVTILRVTGHSKDPHNDQAHYLANYARINKG